MRLMLAWMLATVAWFFARLWLFGHDWRRLAQRWPEGLGYGGFHKFPYVKVGLLTLHGVFVGTESRGIHLASWAFVRFILPPIFVPWTAIGTIVDARVNGSRGLELYCIDPGVTIRIGMGRRDLGFIPGDSGN